MSNFEYIVSIFKNVDGKKGRVADIVLREVPQAGQMLNGYGYVKTVSQPFMIGTDLSKNEPKSGYKVLLG